MKNRCFHRKKQNKLKKNTIKTKTVNIQTNIRVKA